MCTNNTCNPEVDCPNEDECTSGSNCTSGGSNCTSGSGSCSSGSNCPAHGGSCSGDSCNNCGSCDGSCSGSSVLVQSISVVPSTVRMTVGQWESLSVYVDPVTASSEVTWYSSNKDVATVGPSGNVYAMGVGTAVIVATTKDGSNHQASCFVVVKEAQNVPVTSVALNRSTLTLQKNSSGDLYATVCPTNATDPSVCWYSDNESIAVVEDGTVYAVNVGQATICAVSRADRTKCDSCLVTVEDNSSTGNVPVTSIVLSQSSAKISRYTSVALTATVQPSNATNKNVVWTSSNESVATVENGVIYGEGNGVATIIATAADGSGVSATCIVTVGTPSATGGILVTAISVHPSSLVFYAGETVALSHSWLPANATKPSVEWSSSNPAVVTVNPDSGIAMAQGSGYATIYATAKDGSNVQGTCSVHVRNEIPVTSVNILRESVTISMNQTVDLNAYVSPDSATNKNVFWSSANTSVANVDEDGTVTPVGPGTTTICAVSVADSSKCDSCTVTVKNEIVVESVTMVRSEVSLNPGKTAALVASILPEEATNKTLNWRSTVPSVADVDKNGLVTAKKVGMATIYATANGGKSGSCKVTVMDPPEVPTVETPVDPTKMGKVADPVDTYSGAHTLQNTLLRLFGGQELSIVAHYASNHLAEGSMGKGWYHSFEKSVCVEDGGARQYTSPSTFLQFEPCGDGIHYSCTSPGKSGYVLTKNSSSTEARYCVDCNRDSTEYYNADGHLTKVVDHQGFETTVAYSASLITVTDTVTGKKLYLQKLDCGKICRVYDDAGRETLLTYEGNCLKKITDPRGNALTFTYDSEGRVLTGTDSLGVIYFENTYDTAGRVSTQKDGTRTATSCAAMSRFFYDETGIRALENRNGEHPWRVFNTSGMLTKYVDENGNETTYAYDGNFNLIEEKDPLGKSVQKVYNDLGKPTSVTDKNGSTTTLEYDDQGNLLKIVYPAGFGSETFTYNSRNQRLTHTDLRGTTTTYTYYSNGLPKTKKVGSLPAETYTYTGGLLTSHTDARGNETKFVHNDMGLVTKRTDAEGHITGYEYDACGNLTKTICYLAGEDGPFYTVETTYDGNHQKSSEKDANGNVTRYTYTGNMKLASTILPDDDPNSDQNVIRYEYDREDRLIKTSDPEENATVTCYDPAGRVDCKQAPDESSVSYEYDKAGRVLRETNALGGVTVKTYDANGNVLSVTDPAGNTTDYFYDARNRLVRTCSPVNGATLYSYSPAGDLVRVTDALGNYREYTYDAYGNKCCATDARGNTTCYTYDNNHNLLTVTDPLGYVTTYTYDKLNRLISVTDAKNHTVTYGYDAMGRRVTVKDARNNTVTTTYDGVGNVLTVKDAKNHTVKSSVYNNRNLPTAVTDAVQKTTHYTYNKLGKVASVRDPLGNEQYYAYDVVGRNNRVTDALNGESTALYDGAGNILRLEGPLGGKTEYAYDTSGRLETESTPSGGEKEYTYNAQNLKESLTNARGQIRTYSYDLLGRVTGYTTPEGTVSYTYDANGNVLTVTDQNGIIRRTYDALNRVKTCTDTNGKTISYDYDAVGNLWRLTYPDNTSVTYEYDENNNLTKVTDWANRTTTYTYDANNNVTGITKPNGSTVSTVYDDAQRVTSSVEKTSGGAVITGITYDYDDLGRITSETHQPENVQYDYTYDDLSRVTLRTATDLSTNTQSQETFSYDAAGNLLGSGNTAFTYDANNRLTACNGQTVSYDADGNMTSATLNGSNFACTYDSANRLVSAGGHTYTYNAEDVRIRLQRDGADVSYVYDTNVKLSRMLMKIEGSITTKYVYGLGLIGEEKQNAFKTYHFDCRGSTVAITDQTGTVTDTFRYDTYGKLLSRTGSTDLIFGYNGRDGVVTDTNGLIYMRARYYSPELRRFVNADIIPGAISQAVTLNRYAYANGNPVSNVDPFGLAAWANWLKVGIGVAVIVGAAVTAAVATAPAVAIGATAVLIGSVIGGTAGAAPHLKNGNLDEAATAFLTGSVFGGASGWLTASTFGAGWVAAGGVALDVGEYIAEELINGTPEEITLAGAAVTAATSFALDHVKIKPNFNPKTWKEVGPVKFNMDFQPGWTGANGVLDADAFKTAINHQKKKTNQDYAQKQIKKITNNYCNNATDTIIGFTVSEVWDELDGGDDMLVDKADDWEKSLRAKLNNNSRK